MKVAWLRPIAVGAGLSAGERGVVGVVVGGRSSGKLVRSVGGLAGAQRLRDRFGHFQVISIVAPGCLGGCFPTRVSWLYACSTFAMTKISGYLTNIHMIKKSTGGRGKQVIDGVGFPGI